MEHVVTFAPALDHAHENSRALVWTGRVLTGLIVAFLLVDALGKLIPLAPYVEGTTKLGLRRRSSVHSDWRWRSRHSCI